MSNKQVSNKQSSIGGKRFLFAFLAVFLTALSSQSAAAGSGEEYLYKKNLKLSFNVGLTLTPEKPLLKKAHENILIIIRVPIKKPNPPWVELCFEFGYNAFQYDTRFDESKERFHWWNLNSTLRLTFGKCNKRFKPFISAGPGLYIPKDGDIQWGFKGGLGFGYHISERFMIEFGADYHNIFMDDEFSLTWGDNTDFLHVHGGIVIFL